MQMVGLVELVESNGINDTMQMVKHEKGQT